MTDPTTPRQPCLGSEGKKRVCWARPGTAWCANHDPERAEERRANGGKRKPKAPKPVLPEGWRPEWRAPRPPRVQEPTEERLARAQEILESATPPPAELREEAIRVLRSIALDPGAAEASRVGAARTLLEASAKPAPGEVARSPVAPVESSPPWMQPRHN